MKLTFFIAAILILLFSCEHEVIEPEETKRDGNETIPCDSNNVYFQNDILPIFISSCAFSGCHDVGTAANGVVLTSYEKIINSDVVRAGRPDNSELFERITETDINERMPLGGNRLPQEHIDKIEQWILDGALNSFCNESKMCDTTNVTYSGAISRILKQKCTGCHSGFNPGGGINLTTYVGVKAIADDQRFLNVVLHAPGYKAMPLGGQMLPKCEIETIRIWINQGAPNN